jgi:hypothetical protein
VLPFNVYVVTKYYQRKNVTPVINVLDDIRHNQTNRGRSTQERAQEAAAQQESLGNQIQELLTRTNNTDVADNLRATTGFLNWQEGCVRTVTSEQVEAWAAWRKRSVESILEFVERGLYGQFNGLFASPIREMESQKFLGIHYHHDDLTSNEWYVHPNGVPMQAAIIGDYRTAEIILVGESQWDIDRYISELALFNEENWAAICTRGAGTARLCPQDLAPNAELFALPHIDIHGDFWFSELSMHLMRRMHILRPPPSGQCKDIDDWCRKGGANRDSLAWLIQSVSQQQPEHPRFILPGVDGREGPAEMLYRGLAKTKRFFHRCGELVTLRSGPHTNGEAPVEYLHHSDAYGFLGDIEGFISTYRLTMDKKEGVMVLRPANATDKEAKFFLASPQLSKHSLPLRLISASPVLVERDGEPVVLQKGYHPDVGGLLVENDIKIIPMTLGEAVLILTDGISSPGNKERLGGLFANYIFVTPADYSRAIAQVISPMMKLGQLLPANTDFPVDLTIADSSQSGKSHRLRFTCLLYNEIAYPLTQKTGGVGSLDESFASALVAGRLFIALDNVRGLLNSMVMESYLRG